MGHKSTEDKVRAAKVRQTPETLGFVPVMVIPAKGKRRMERRSLEWYRTWKGRE